MTSWRDELPVDLRREEMMAEAIRLGSIRRHRRHRRSAALAGGLAVVIAAATAVTALVQRIELPGFPDCAAGHRAALSCPLPTFPTFAPLAGDRRSAGPSNPSADYSPPPSDPTWTVVVDHLLDQWRSADRAEASNYATPSAVVQLFSRPYTSTASDGCSTSTAGVAKCKYHATSGRPTTITFELVRDANGVHVSAVSFDP